MRNERLGLLVDGGVLGISADSILGLPPQRFHRVEFRRPCRQPQQPDLQTFRQSARCLGSMATVTIEQYDRVSSTIVPSHFPQKCLEIDGILLLSHQKHAMASGQVHALKYDAPGITSAEHDSYRLTAFGPHRAQWREQQQIGLVLHQHHAVHWQSREGAPNLAFFSLAPDRA